MRDVSETEIPIIKNQFTFVLHLTKLWPAESMRHFIATARANRPYASAVAGAGL